MNIGIVTTWFERGAAYVSLQYQNTLMQNSHNVFIFARGGELNDVKDSKWNFDNVTRSKYYEFPVTTYICDKELENWIKKNNIEMIIFNEQRWLKSVVLCKKLGVKVGAYIDYYTEETIKLHDIYDFVLCNTKRHLSVFSSHKKAIYIPWGTDIKIFDVSTRREKSEKIRFFISVGMNPYRKGFDLFLKAFYLACQNEDFSKNSIMYVHSQINLDQFYKNNIEILEKIKYLRINQLLVEEIGTVTAPGLYHKGDIYVYPSRLDGIGLTLPEALAAGMSVIIPNEPPMNEFVPPNSNFSFLVNVDKYYARKDGYYWPQNEVNVESFLEGLNYFYKNKNNLIEYSREARNYAQEKLDWNKNSKQLSIELNNIKFHYLDEKNVSEIKYFYEAKYPYLYNKDYIYKLIFKFKPFFKKIIQNKFK